MKCRASRPLKILLALVAIALCFAASSVALAIGLNVQTHTKQEIIDFMGAHPADRGPVTYATAPSLSEPIRAGVLSQDSVSTTLNALNQVRYVAGVSANVQANAGYSEFAAAAALINALNGREGLGLSHYPSRPAALSDSKYDALFQLGYAGAGKSNLAGGGSLSFGGRDAILLFMSDSDSSNIDRVGHRRWVIAPGLHTVGIGFAEGYMALNIMDGYTRDSSTRVAWPAQLTPIEFFSATDAWSLFLGATTSKQSVSVQLVRQSDKQTWNFSSSNSDGYFNVNSESYGQDGSCVIFRPSGLSSIRDGDRFSVTATVAGGNSIQYDVEFFDPAPEPDIAPASISIEPAGPVEVKLGDALQLSVRFEPADAKCDLVWESDNSAVANVDDDGEVYALTCGTAHITATASKPDAQGNPVSAGVTITVFDPTRPTGVRFEPAGPLDLSVGDTVQLRVVLEPEGARIPDMAFPSIHTSIFTHVPDGDPISISEDHKLTALSAGSGELQCGLTFLSPFEWMEGNVISFTIHDPEIPESLTLDTPSGVAIEMDETLKLNATLAPATAGGLLWQSTNPAVAMVSDSGLVTPVGGGETTIIVKTERNDIHGSQLSQAISVKVIGPDAPGPIEPEPPADVTRVRLNRVGVVSLSLSEGETLQLRATLSPGDAQSALEWFSSRPNVADVDETGLVTPIREGMARITVRAVEQGASGARPSASVTIKVVDSNNASPLKPTGISLDVTGTVELDLTETLALFATLEPENAWSDFKWSSSNKKIATVDENGIVTPRKTGKATITVKTTRANAKGRKLSAKVTLRIVDRHKPTAIHLDQSGKIPLNIDETLTLRASLEPENAISGIQWSSSNKKIAKLSADPDTGECTVIPVREGKAVITAKTTKSNPKGKKLSAKISVQVIDPYKPTGVEIDQAGPLELNIGDSMALTATLAPDIARSKLTWSSSNSKIAKLQIDPDTGECTVTGRKEGSAKISVKTRNGKKATVKIKIVDPAKATGVRLDQEEPVELPLNATLILAATLLPDTATSKLSWSSSNEKLATVRKATEEDVEEGVSPANRCVVTPKRKGSVKISVKTSTGKKAGVTVTIVDALDEFEAAPESAPDATEAPPEALTEEAESPQATAAEEAESPQGEGVEIEFTPEEVD